MDFSTANDDTDGMWLIVELLKKDRQQRAECCKCCAG